MIPEARWHHPAGHQIFRLEPVLLMAASTCLHLPPRTAGGAQGQLGHLLLVLLLDFPVPLHRKGPPLPGSQLSAPLVAPPLVAPEVQ